MWSSLPNCGTGVALGRAATIVLMLTIGEAAFAQRVTPDHVDRLNALLAGRLLDFTHNHGQDHRRYSCILRQPRDLYVYLPPGYAPSRAYPLVLWLHGAFGDEHIFLDQSELQYLDDLIRRGCAPPMIVACPDGTYCGENQLGAAHSLFLNGAGGAVQDHLLHEVLPFLTAGFSVAAERERHALVGVSAGGTGAMNLLLTRPEFFGAAASIAGAVNLRYGNVQGDYLADFNPATYRWKTAYRSEEVIAQYWGGLIEIPAGRFIEPVFGRGPDVVPRVIQQNPADLLFLQPPPLETPILLCFGGRDQFNMDAQGASFAWLAESQGVTVEVCHDPHGDHTGDYFIRAQRQVWRWLGKRLAPWKPDASARD
jgi:S-formylglutathione hydrolase FrmB